MNKKNNKEEKQNAEEKVEVQTDNQEQVLSEEEKISKLEAKIEELNDKYIRLYSEFDNYRKRTSKERIELIKTAGEDIFKVFLPVIDDVERAMKQSNEAIDINAVKEGLNLIQQKLKNSLKQKGLEEMISIGQEFNTDLHEAITNTPAPSEDMKGKVIDELEKGYILNGKVIRFAKVVVGN